MFLVELLEVFFAPFVLIYKLFMPDPETGKATISGYVFVPLGLVFGSVLLLGLLWSLAVAFFPKFASAPPPNRKNRNLSLSRKPIRSQFIRKKLPVKLMSI